MENVDKSDSSKVFLDERMESNPIEEDKVMEIDAPVVEVEPAMIVVEGEPAMMEEHKTEVTHSVDKPQLTVPENQSKVSYYRSILDSLAGNERGSFLMSNPEVQLALEFNYEFNNKQKLVDIDTKEPFKFTNQKDYERLGKVVQRVIENMMTNKYGLNRVEIPTDSSTPKSYIYISSNFNNPSQQHPKALLLIQGAGAVRPGIWARSVCINDSLKTGSMNSFLAFANKHQFEVIIFNPNKTRSKGKQIPKNGSLEQHGIYVWERFIRDSSPKDLYIVAHSCGGLSTVSLMNQFWKEFKERVKGIAFTDAVHGYYGMKAEKLEFCKRRAVDWVASRLPLDEKECKRGDPIVYVSSGHQKHEYTTGSARKSIKKYLLQIENSNPYLRLIE